MTERIKEIKHLQQDGTFKTYPIGADASNIDLQNGKTLEAALRENYVQRTDYATNLKGGVIKTSSAYGTQTGSGLLSGVTYSYADYQNKSHQNGFISKGTLENVITGKELVNKTYVDTIVGDIGTAIDEINGEIIGG